MQHDYRKIFVHDIKYIFITYVLPFSLVSFFKGTLSLNLTLLHEFLNLRSMSDKEKTPPLMYIKSLFALTNKL